MKERNSERGKNGAEGARAPVIPARYRSESGLTTVNQQVNGPKDPITRGFGLGGAGVEGIMTSHSTVPRFSTWRSAQ